MLFLDFANLTLDFTVVFRYAIELGHCCPGFLYAAFAISMAGRFREEEDSQAEDDRPDETDAHRDTPRGGIGARLSAEIDGVGGENPRCDEKLVRTHERSAYLPGSSFAGVHGYHY